MAMSFLSGLLPATHGAVAQGILWAVMALGVYITFKILNSPDLTVEGSFALGGAVAAVLIEKGMHPLLAILAAAAAGCVAGLVTGLLDTKLGIPTILAGILTMIALYSVNIRVMGDKSMISLLGMPTLQAKVKELLPLSSYNTSILIGALFCGGLIAFLYWFFGTEIGCAVRATGNNPNMVRALGADTDWTRMIALMLSNGLIAVSGALVAQDQGSADVTMGTGAIVIGLASIIIGEVIFGKRFNFAYRLATVVFGSLIYRIVIALVLQMGLTPTDLKLLTALIVAVALSLPTVKAKVVGARNGTKNTAEKSA